MSTARYVGRVGALAVVLGVGGAILALPATAGAETGSDTATGSAEASDRASVAGGA
ncbi:MAG: hypothetical protein QG655_546, partial [Actinomycetota bacterium]|nr:hypothetical protein [Actinomycetota bacterium]